MTDQSTDPSEIRKRRILFRAWHRGTREMDLLMGRFADKFAGALSEAELTDLEALMEMPDPDIYNWIVGAADTPAEYDTPLLRRMREFHLGDRAKP
jgi:antitoxin CptB